MLWQVRAIGLPASRSPLHAGASHVAGEDAQQNQVAVAELPAPNRLDLRFPAPQVESKPDILVLEG